MRQTIVSTEAVNMGEELFCDPEEFRPERVKPENIGDIKCIFMPFGDVTHASGGGPPSVHDLPQWPLVLISLCNHASDDNMVMIVSAEAVNMDEELFANLRSSTQRTLVTSKNVSSCHSAMDPGPALSSITSQLGGSVCGQCIVTESNTNLG
ncbi:hypothetical protein KGM_208104 [Danaus plexippus plexippus]|uniref:Uncharacterized protein n=1 Tax=Danaus plexippus plexippus TaxID=278856 RepID=A0A212FE64_DANPL|nr:hypothetical protein KGM_208104 [Danaus plexippus plexippus]